MIYGWQSLYLYCICGYAQCRLGQAAPSKSSKPQFMHLPTWATACQNSLRKRGKGPRISTQASSEAPSASKGEANECSTDRAAVTTSAKAVTEPWAMLLTLNLNVHSHSICAGHGQDPPIVPVQQAYGLKAGRSHAGAL